MLMSRPRTVSTHAEVANIHNYYERLVTESITKTDKRAIEDADFLADVSCVALNHLPPRYIRHDVDMSFFMSPVEREETEEKVQTAVDYALVFVRQREEERQEFTSEDIITDAVESEEDVEQAIAEESSQPPIEQEDATPKTDVEADKPVAESGAENVMGEAKVSPDQSTNIDASSDNTDVPEIAENPMSIENHEQNEDAPADFSMADMPRDDADASIENEVPELTPPSAQADTLSNTETSPPQ